jgi:hypothetical protein
MSFVNQVDWEVLSGSDSDLGFFDYSSEHYVYSTYIIAVLRTRTKHSLGFTMLGYLEMVWSTNL